MSNIDPNEYIIKMRMLSRNLCKLFEDPHIGLVSWHTAVQVCIDEINKTYSEEDNP